MLSKEQADISVLQQRARKDWRALRPFLLREFRDSLTTECTAHRWVVRDWSVSASVLDCRYPPARYSAVLTTQCKDPELLHAAGKRLLRLKEFIKTPQANGK